MKNFKITTSKSIFVLFTIAVILISCNKAVDPLGGEKLSPVIPANNDSNAGNWQMIVLTGPTQFTVAPPVPATDPTYQAELATIRNN